MLEHHQREVRALSLARAPCSYELQLDEIRLAPSSDGATQQAPKSTARPTSQ
jgi:hypothetical protein